MSDFNKGFDSPLRSGVYPLYRVNKQSKGQFSWLADPQVRPNQSKHH
jgi:hypothetical protein